MKTSESTVLSLHTPLSAIDEMITQLSSKVRVQKKIRPRITAKRAVFPVIPSTSLILRYVPGLIEVDLPRRVYRLCSCRTLDNVLTLLKLSRATLEVLYDFSEKVIAFDFASQFSLLNATMTWLEDDTTKNIKYFCCYPMARFLRNPLPVCPPSFMTEKVKRPLIFSGPILRFLKNRLNSFNRHNTFLWNSFLQGIKRGCHVVNDSFVTATLQSHAEALSHAPDWEQIEPKIFRQYVDEILEDLVPLPKDIQFVEPSTSSCFGLTRSRGGGRLEVISDMVDFDPFLDSELNIRYPLEPMELIAMTYSPLRGEESWYGYYFSRADLYYRLNSPSWRSRFMRNCVQVHPIVEPLKCRIITKAPGFLTFLCHPLQQHIWKYLYTLPAFRLLGELVDLSMLKDVFPLEGEGLVSGDYSSATDGIDLRLTKLVMESLLEKVEAPLWLQEASRLVLYEQKMYYPQSLSGLDPLDLVRDQLNGQLMGSILSFPVLCIINLITYWMALDNYNGFHSSMKELRVLVNGDDILFPASQNLYDCWRSLLPSFGFKLSIGKNYFHERVCTVNSQCFWKESQGFVPIFFLNTGLLTGQSKHSGRNSTRQLPCNDYYNEVVHTSNNPIRTHRRFLHYFKSEISSLTNEGEFNLFLPREFGGLDFLPPGGLQYHLTPFQKRWATFSVDVINRRISRRKSPFRICLVQEVKGRVSPYVQKPVSYIWVPKVLNEQVKNIKSLHSMVLNRYVSSPTPLQAPLFFESLISPLKSQVVARLPPKVMKNSFRRQLNNLKMIDQAPNYGLQEIDWLSLNDLSLVNSILPESFKNPWVDDFVPSPSWDCQTLCNEQDW